MYKMKFPLEAQFLASTDQCDIQFFQMLEPNYQQKNCNI